MLKFTTYYQKNMHNQKSERKPLKLYTIVIILYAQYITIPKTHLYTWQKIFLSIYRDLYVNKENYKSTKARVSITTHLLKQNNLDLYYIYI